MLLSLRRRQLLLLLLSLLCLCLLLLLRWSRCQLAAACRLLLLRQGEPPQGRLVLYVGGSLCSLRCCHRCGVCLLQVLHCARTQSRVPLPDELQAIGWQWRSPLRRAQGKRSGLGGEGTRCYRGERWLSREGDGIAGYRK